MTTPARRIGLVIGATLATLSAAAPAPVSAAPRLVLDVVEAEPSYFFGLSRVRAFVTAVELEGRMIPVSGKDAWLVQLGAVKKKDIPVVVGRWDEMDGRELAIALVLEVSADYEPHFEEIRVAAKAFLDQLPNDTQVMLVTYGEEVTVNKVSTPQATMDRLDAIDAETYQSYKVLLEAMDRAVKGLERVAPEVETAPMRKIVIVVSDGDDEDPDPDLYRRTGLKAADEDIRIHSIGYSPYDNRRPLRGLGEMSNVRSLGTFRWVRDPSGFQPAFRQVLDEINKQYVLTFFVPTEDLDRAKLTIHHNDISSNEVRITEILCGTETCGDDQYCVDRQCVSHAKDESTGVFGWLLRLILIVVGAALVLGVVGWYLTHREKKAEDGPPAPIPGQEPSPGAPPAPQHIQASPTQPVLYVVNGAYQGHRFPVKHGFTLGKATTCDLVLAGDSFASSLHAQILMDRRGGCTLVDKQSTNGTFVNGVRSTEMRLQHGMLIRVGQTDIRFLTQ